MSEMIWPGRIVPWRARSRRIVTSVIEPLPWWPRIGLPFTAAVSTGLPPLCPDTAHQRLLAHQHQLADRGVAHAHRAERLAAVDLRVLEQPPAVEYRERVDR